MVMLSRARPPEPPDTPLTVAQVRALATRLRGHAARWHDADPRAVSDLDDAVAVIEEAVGLLACPGCGGAGFLPGGRPCPEECVGGRR